ncbi:MAG: DUF3048 domain-containing protein [Eubacteriales bacterium]
MKKLTLLFLTLSLAFMLGGCGEEEVVETVVEEPIEVIELEVEEIEEVVEEVIEDIVPEGMYRSELTNEPIDESLMDQRPIAAMVDNEITAWPHFGLSEADVVYEMMNSTANDRITRFMVLVKDWASIEQLGSIRSARTTNIWLAAEWNAVLCHDGGPFYIDQYIAEDYIDNFNGGFSRVNNGKATEFTEYIMAGDLETRFENNPSISVEYNEYYQGEHFQFTTESYPIDYSEDETALEASAIYLPFEHNGSYLLYDEETQLYQYYGYDQEHLDGEDDAPLVFKNLLIQKCTFSEYDENGYMLFNTVGVTGETGYYLTNGKAVPITWSKGDYSDITHYYNSDEEELTINTGKTYIALVPDDNWQDLVIE